MSDLISRLTERLALNAKIKLHASIDNAKDVELEFSRLMEKMDRNWDAGRAAGFSAGMDAENVRLQPILQKLLAVVAAAERLCACTYRRVTDNTDFALKTIIDEQCDNCKALSDLRRECE